MAEKKTNSNKLLVGAVIVLIIMVFFYQPRSFDPIDTALADRVEDLESRVQIGGGAIPDGIGIDTRDNLADNTTDQLQNGTWSKLFTNTNRSNLAIVLAWGQNPFDQNLNTTNDVEFENVTVDDKIKMDNGGVNWQIYVNATGVLVWEVV